MDERVNYFKESGKVWLIGAGPGDSGLFTLKGKAVLSRAEVVLYDKLVGQGIIDMIPEESEKIFVGKMAGNHIVPQEEINEIILNKALEGKNVVRLKGGDPFVFGRGGEELELLLENNIPFEIVPGITSAISVPAYSGIPVTHRDFTSSLHIITGHTRDGSEAKIDYESLVKLNGTLVFLMGVKSLSEICSRLILAGMDKKMPAAILEKGTTAHQRRVVSNLFDLSSKAEAEGIETPAIIIVGEVCSLSKKFNWAESRPLGGLKIGITRPSDRSSYLADELAFLGAEVVLIPSIINKKIEDNHHLEKAILEIESYSWAVFTSPVGVKIFFEKLRDMKRDIRTLGNLKFAAIGSATKETIEKMGIVVNITPQIYSGETLGKLVAGEVKAEEKKTGQKSKILIPRSVIGTDEVILPIIEQGLEYLDLPIYETNFPNDRKEIPKDMDYVFFTSASTVKGFAKLGNMKDYKKIKGICIGRKTAEEAGKYGMKIFMSEKATMDSMVECLLKVVKK